MVGQCFEINGGDNLKLKINGGKCLEINSKETLGDKL